MPETAARAASAPGTILVITVMAAAIAGTVLLRAGRVQVGSVPAAATPDMRLNVNTATAVELNALPGIGPALAERIAADRAANGPFASLEDVTRVRGIGPRLIERVASHVVCN